MKDRTDEVKKYTRSQTTLITERNAKLRQQIQNRSDKNKHKRKI